jgi:hypothetical protein
MVVSIISISVVITMDYVFVRVMGFDVWGLAAAYSIGSFIQATSLFYLINKKTKNGSFFRALLPIGKSVIASVGAGSVMFLILKFFDRSVWVKRLSFINTIDAGNFIPFDKFVLDTRYTINLLALTLIVSLIGGVTYIALSVVMRSKQVWNFFNLVKRILFRKKVLGIPSKEQEPIAPTPTDTTS